MRSHSSRSSHRSSMHRSSTHRSSMHSSLHRHSIASRMHKRAFKRHGISNVHAFAVGKATGININGSGLGAHGAALHRIRRLRENTTSHRNTNTFYRSYASRHRSDNNIRRVRISNSRKRYTSPKYDFSQFTNIGEEFNTAINEASKYVWIPILIISIMLIFFIIFFLFIINIRFRFL